MAWGNWDQFKELFKDFNFIRLDAIDKNNISTMDDKELLYNNGGGAFSHPIIEFKRNHDASKKNKTKSQRTNKSTRKGRAKSEAKEEKED